MLKQLDENDLSLIREWRNSEKVRRVMFTDHIISYAEHLCWWENIKKDKTKQCFMYYFQGRKAGVVCYTGLGGTSLSWGFYLSNQLETKKIQLQVWKNLEEEALEYGFSCLNADKIVARVFEFNYPVIKMHQRFGFKIVAEEEKEKDQKIQKVIVMSLKQTELKNVE